jgi:riboflavin kinase/FMN adenylyltransferase
MPEIYIIDFSEDIYDRELNIKVIRRIRGEEKFNSAGELVKQIQRDKEKGLKILSKVN